MPEDQPNSLASRSRTGAAARPLAVLAGCALLLIGIIAVGLFGCSELIQVGRSIDLDSSTPAHAIDNTVLPTNVLPVYSATVAEVARAFAAGEDTAEQAYGGHQVRVTGAVIEVDYDYAHNPRLQLQTENGALTASMSLTASSRSQGATLRHGQQIDAVCQDVDQSIQTLEFGECELQ